MPELQETFSTEWDDIVCLPIIDISKNYNENDISTINEQEFDFITNQQLSEHIYKIDLGEQRRSSLLNFEPKCNFAMRMIRYVLFWQTYHLKHHLMAEGNRIIKIASQSFDNRNKFHLRCLYTIFSKLTGNVTTGFKRFGHHWEDIGFQGSDPSTDFRGVGILGLFQLTFFVVSPKVCSLSKEIYELSLDGNQHYPFAITSMNITQLSLQMLKDGLLNNFINESDSVLTVFNQIYYGTFLRFHKIWKNERKTIMDIGFVLKDLKQTIRKNPKKILDELIKYNSMEVKLSKQEDFTNIININQNQS